MRLPSLVTRFLPSAALLLGVVDAAPAQPAVSLSSADRSYLERLAFARARAALWDQVERLPLPPRPTIGAWAAQEISLERALRLWVRTRPRYGSVRTYSDGTCDVDVRLLADELAAELVTLLEAHGSPQGPALQASDVLKAARQWPILWGAGSATVASKGQTRRPIGWEDVGAEGIYIARRAAVADAVHALLEQAGQLKVTPAHRLREFLGSDDAVFEAVYEAVSDAATIVVENAPDQVAVAQAQIAMTDFIRILTEAHVEHYRGDLFHAPDFREMALSARQTELRAEGLATPPARYRLQEPYELIDLDRPAWADQTLTVTGRYDPLDTELFRHEVRVELARFDGMDQLRQKVEKLVIKEGVTIEELLGYHRHLKDDVVIFLGGARAVSRPHTEPDGVLTVRVELPLERLWLIVRRGMERVEVDPPGADKVESPETDEGTNP